MTSAHTPTLTLEFDGRAQVRASLLAAAFAGVFYSVFEALWYEWTHSADWSHGPIIPIFSAYLLFVNWDKIRRCPASGHLLGLVLMIASLALYQVSLWAILFGYIRPTAMLLCLLGIVVYLRGVAILRYALVPWLYLFFAVPLPKEIYFRLTDPLRRIAATVATAVLKLMPDLQIERIGSTIEYYHSGRSGQLGVADACSGMRSTITLCALGVAVAFLSQRPMWQRVVMIVACVPIAVFSNFIRVSTTCLLHIYADPKYSEGTYHTALGLFTLMIAFLLFNLLGWILSNLFVEAKDEPGAGDADLQTGGARS
ncbi:MAG: exosortase/archaeosortase family protein [Planctomycetes bacterium]|nr:exosortase/archaeosortase family protein [Planctomycetota bacterium]